MVSYSAYIGNHSYIDSTLSRSHAAYLFNSFSRWHMNSSISSFINTIYVAWRKFVLFLSFFEIGKKFINFFFVETCCDILVASAFLIDNLLCRLKIHRSHSLLFSLPFNRHFIVILIYTNKLIHGFPVYFSHNAVEMRISSIFLVASLPL